jgi:TolB protein
MRRSWFFLPCLLWAAPVWAQQHDPDFVPSGVRIGLLYEEAYRPRFAVEPLRAYSPAAYRVADEVHFIMQRDLDYSDRFNMVNVPHRMSEDEIDYARWNAMGVDYLTTGELIEADDGYELRLTLHDVVYNTINQSEAFQIPDPQAPDFRMAVHAVADEVVLWATGQPGMAASRIAFIRVNRDGSRDLMLIDSDGENLQRVASGGPNLLLSPAWSPNASRIAYTVGTEASWELHELDLTTGNSSVISNQAGNHFTPAYSPDGSRLAFALSTPGGNDLHEIDVADGGSLRRITRGPLVDMSPTYSPDGRRVAFNSDRLGQAHIYVMPADGGEPTLLTRFVYGEPGQYNAPSWSPTGSLVAFHGRSRGAFQIMVADADRPGATVQQITADGRSEDPSWAPDGRHVVFSGWRPAGEGLYVVDTVTGRLRPLILGGRYPVPDWSPTLVRASAPDVRGR